MVGHRNQILYKTSNSKGRGMQTCFHCGKELRYILDLDTGAKAVMHVAPNLCLQPAEFLIDIATAANDSEFLLLIASEVNRCRSGSAA
ncbi:MAG TPA: hypothetical protein VFP59_19595 [Candidatus Angelobacter sp.]|nr:hypothetical protein [Candidatus Angelobacter sp.]